MISDIAAWFITLFVLSPIQADVQERMQGANASAQSIQQSQQCITAQGPKLIQRAGEDPSWAIATAVGYTIGWTSPSQLLDANDPNCAELTRLLQGNEGEEANS
ncbi:hypothetical protein [Agrobacterium bohemicum]|uniref:Uncharacterized protein n=1 Tax=Agrobacterium bohemicum TaxID=2052828 RepID=A0A135NXU1_9HYPH|nr:hypothetical protein [Agrobacterium bohemicum]KXG83993.1 hypothetical protein ATO67_15835 [Agrobacterium bohemicum]